MVSPAVTAAQSLLSPLAMLRSFAERAVLGLGGPGFEVFAVLVAEHVGELADQVPSGGELLAAGGDLGECGAVADELAGRGEDPAGHFLGRGRGWWCGNGGVVAELGGEPTQVRASTCTDLPAANTRSTAGPAK